MKKHRQRQLNQMNSKGYKLSVKHEPDLVKAADSVVCKLYPEHISLHEVSYGLKTRIDHVLYEKHDIITIEYKMKNWKQAIKQAKKHRAYANQCWILMPASINSITVLQACTSAGIGLMLYSGSVINRVVKPKDVSVQRSRNQLEKRILSQYLKKGK